MMNIAELKAWISANFWKSEQVAGWANSQFFRKAIHRSESSGSSSAGLPIVLDADGKIDASMLNDADIDHGSIGGLADDDHTQYHNNARGDARYAMLTGNQTIAGNKTFSGVIIPKQLQPAAVNVANGALGGLSVWTPVTNGLLIVNNISYGTVGLFAVRAALNTVVEMSDASGQFSTTAGTASSVNVYYLGGTGYVIQNNMGGGAFISVLGIGA